MLRTNLSTRPFYNERLVHLALTLAALIVAVLTVANVVKVVQLSRDNADLSARIGRDRSEAERLTREATRIRRGIDQNDLKLVVAAAQEANQLIDSRTFSWTAFFNHIEAEMPPDVMLASVRPTINEKGTRVTMIVLGRRAVDIDEFVEKLEATGAFEDVLPRQQNLTDEGLTQTTIEAWYVPAAPGVEPPPTKESPAKEPPVKGAPAKGAAQ
jgi:hypothetical protein